jgi:hypothetical protein
MTSDVADFSGAPAFLTKPNFLDVPQEYVDKVEGITPNRTRDEIYLDVEPITGTSNVPHL